MRGSANFVIGTDVVSAGAGAVSSTNFVSRGTLGQSSPVGTAGSTNFALLSGFNGVADSDGDGTPDDVDTDDGVPDAQDAFPPDPSESVDTDSDGIGNNADTGDDNDGMPDDYEDANMLDKLNAADAALDADGDRSTNFEEFEAGSDPQKSASRPVTPMPWLPLLTEDSRATNWLTLTPILSPQRQVCSCITFISAIHGGRRGG